MAYTYTRHLILNPKRILANANSEEGTKQIKREREKKRYKAELAMMIISTTQHIYIYLSNKTMCRAKKKKKKKDLEKNVFASHFKHDRKVKTAKIYNPNLRCFGERATQRF